jgi:hypothetical protein
MRLEEDMVYTDISSYVQRGLKTTSLHAMYTSLLRDHAIRSGVPQDIQLLILQWVTHATRPLRLIELAEIISIMYQVVDLTSSKHLIRAAAGPLLEILPNETVCVIQPLFH